MKKLNKKGFTIVELVIVIAVIAILAGVLIPTFAGVIEKANESNALQEAKNAYTEDLVALDGQADNYDKADYQQNVYTAVAADATFDADATYYTEADGVYTEATVTAETFAPAGLYVVSGTESICKGVFAADGSYTYTTADDSYTYKYDETNGWVQQ